VRRVRAGLAVLALATIGGLASAAPATAAGGTYDVVQCHPLHRGIPDAKITDNAAYAVRQGCPDEDSDHAIRIDNIGAASDGQAGRVRWNAPPGTGIVAVTLGVRLRRDGGHKARVYMADGQLRETARVATGTNSGTGWISESWSGPAQDQLVVSLQCDDPADCRESDAAKAWARNIRITLKDFEDPEVEVGGTLLGGGWLRGTHTLAVSASDVGSGVGALSATLPSGLVAEADPACGGQLADSAAFSRLAACPSGGTLTTSVDTASAPWANGSNTLAICAVDAGTNRTCDEGVVQVDNEHPKLAFLDALNPDDPELIQVEADDPHSGVAQGIISYRAVGATDWTPLLTQRNTGALTARVDSASEPPGEYEFMVEATDVAGNEASTTLREDGTPMRLSFPLRSGVDLEARLKPGGGAVQNLEYGEASRAAGRLTTAAGEPMAGEEVVVDEYFGEGALIDHRIRTVVTDENGRWSSKLPAGPSRSVTATYGGDQRYLDASEAVGRLSVQTGARFATSRARVPEGKKLTFEGRVGRKGARIPSRGKLIQLQYHDPTSKRWFTVRNAFYTDSRGHYRFGYKFGRHYLEDVKIRFRLRVMPESNWPYKPVNTRARRVIVVAR
jgi:hypothetical protein